PEIGTIVNTITGQYQYDYCAFNGENLFVSNWSNNNIDIYEPSTGELIRTLSIELDGNSYIDEIGLSDDYLLLLIVHYGKDSIECSIRYYDINDGTEKGSWSVDYYTWGLSNGKDLNTVYVYNINTGKLETRKISNGELVKSVSIGYYGYCLSYSQSMDLLLISSGGKKHTMINPETGEIIKELSFNEYMMIAADESGGVRWLKAEVDRATVPARGSYKLLLNFNSEGIVPGTYKANVEIVHFREWEPGPFYIPCELTVLPNSDLSITPNSIDIGDVEIGAASLND
ncbi:MAG: hypothetical protein PVI26_01230, partial [Chitinispirillia bacterium]